MLKYNMHCTTNDNDIGSSIRNHTSEKYSGMFYQCFERPVNDLMAMLEALNPICLDEKTSRYVVRLSC